ncbi:MAG: SDR family oxidoreductase [Candidatus Hinthialibacter antarcticus]|nr:SDR family oxidoreductase [Candidatus Hinthialibacter antarcticus]
MKIQPPKSVLISGASTGIGRAVALYLDKKGWRVFAGYRKDADAESLKNEASEHLTPVRLDVANSDSIAETVGSVNEIISEYGLDALINNAGVAVGGPVEFVTRDQWRQQFEINFFGAIELTQCCLPMLRKTKGRIVNVSSIAGRSSMPFTAPYCSSKYAMEALSDSLRLELRQWGIQTVLIEPGAIETPIWGKATEQTQQMETDSASPAMQLYGKALTQFNQVLNNAAKRAAPVDLVVQAVRKALEDEPPRDRYVVGQDARMRLLLKLFPTRFQDWVLAKNIGLDA